VVALYLGKDENGREGHGRLEECCYIVLGAETPLYLALLPENSTSPHGSFL